MFSSVTWVSMGDEFTVEKKTILTGQSPHTPASTPTVSLSRYWSQMSCIFFFFDGLDYIWKKVDKIRKVYAVDT